MLESTILIYDEVSEMSDKHPTKMIIVQILNILQKYTDENHVLSQQQIQKLMESEYGAKIDRKTVRHNLSMLMETGFPIAYRGSDCDNDAITRKGRNGEVETILTDWYYIHKFSAGELRLLIDSVLLADGLSKKYRLDLIGKLESLSSKYFHSITQKIDMDIYGRLQNRQILLTLENIGQAIAEDKQLAFNYCECGTDGELRLRQSQGKVKEYVVNPYQLISKNGHPYLISNMPEREGLTHFRVDRIKNSKLLDSAAKSLRDVDGFKSGIRLSDYVKEHPNLWSGTPEAITFRCKQYMMNDVADSFGTELRIEKLPEGMMEVHVLASEDAMLHWALQFADEVEVLSPRSIRTKMTDILRKALERYEK